MPLKPEIDRNRTDRRKALAHIARGALFFLLLTPALAHAQAAAPSAITGHVSGPRGIALPGVTVLLVNHQTSQELKTWTDRAGNYSFQGIAPGTYSVKFKMTGFSPAVRDGIIVNSAGPSRADAALKFQSSSSHASAVRAAATKGTPAAAAAGTRAAKTSDSRREHHHAIKPAKVHFTKNKIPAKMKEPRSEYVIDQSASDANSFLLSGNLVRAEDPAKVQAQYRKRAAEFRAKSHRTAFGAGSKNASLPGLVGGHWASRPSKVNEVRGNLFEEFSNSALDANPYPLNTSSSPQIASHFQHFAFSLGGPVVLPHVYNGRDKTSFYLHYNLQRMTRPFDIYPTVPTLAERNGDFSQSTISAGPFAGATPVIYDPLSNPLGPRQPFAGNQIPGSRISPVATGLLDYIPPPNLPGSVQNFHLQQSLPSAHDRVMGRIVHQFSGRDSFSAFYYFNSSRSKSVRDYPGLDQNRSLRGQNLDLAETHTINPLTVNAFTAGFNRERINTLNPFAFSQNIAGDLGVQGVSQLPMDWGIPWIDFTNFNPLNDVIPSLIRNQTFHLADAVVMDRGAHNLKFGFQFADVQLNAVTDPNARGTFIFSGYSTSNFTAGGAPVGGTGFDFADFLLGLPQTTSVRYGTSSNYFRSQDFAGFAQDDWKASQRLTVAAGLRYEYSSPFHEKYGHLSNLVVGQGFSTATLVTAQSPGSYPASLINGDRMDFSPRIGIAFRPWASRGLVIRAGYGMFYDQSIYQRLVSYLANQPPFAHASTRVTSPSSVLTLADGFPSSGQKPLRNTYAVDPHYLTPYAQTWNLMLEEEISPDLIATLSYVGTRGTHLNLLIAPNTAAPGSLSGGLLLANAAPFIYDASGASSIYQSVQGSLRRQFHSGFSFDINYTYSKAMDNAASVGGYGNIVAQNPFNLATEWGLSGFNSTHQLLIDDVYEFPLGPRRRFLNNGGFLAGLLGNWQIGSVTTYQSGFPYTAYILGNISNNVAGAAPFSSLRAQATGAPAALAGSRQSTLQFFNTGAFTLPPAGYYGNAGRNTIPGPDLLNFNVSLDRFVTFSDQRNITGDFRLEADNILNHPNFSGLGTVVNAANYGRITSVLPMRSLQISFRLQF